MFRTICAATLLALALSVPASAMRPTHPGEAPGTSGHMGGGSHPQPQICPIPEREVKDAATILSLCSDTRVLKEINSAVSRGHLKVSRVTSYPGGAGRTGYKFVLEPIVAPPAGIHGGGFFTVTCSSDGTVMDVTRASMAR